jgi:hypothetical protein
VNSAALNNWQPLNASVSNISINKLASVDCNFIVVPSASLDNELEIAIIMPMYLVN